MGSSLTGTKIKDTYSSLVKVSDNGALDGTLQVITDGLGNNSALSLSTAGASVTGTLAVSGATTLSSTLAVTGNLTVDTNTLYVDASNNRVGIGTTPSAKLHLGGTAPLDSIIRQDSTASGTNWEIGEREAGKWQIWQDDTDSVVATFTSSGNVGIGTTSVSGGAKLHIASANGTTYAANAQLRISGAGVNNNVAQIVFSDDALSDGKISYFPSAAPAGQILSLSARSTQSDFVLTGDGYARLGSSMGGLQFGGDTSSANALDDYEEGTWTPTVADASSGGNLATLTADSYGAYTKIGNVVYFRFNVILSSKGSMSSGNDVWVRGFPYVSVPISGNWYNPSATIIRNTTFSGYVQFHQTGGSTYGYFRYNESGGTGGNIIVSQTTDSSAMQVSGFYSIS